MGVEIGRMEVEREKVGEELEVVKGMLLEAEEKERSDRMDVSGKMGVE